MEKLRQNKAITLIVLVITIIILLILAGITISSLGGEHGLFAKTKQARETQTKAEMKEQLILALQELQIEKTGKATLDDVTQEWADSKLEDYEPIIENDASTNGKKVTMSKNGVIGKYVIDENFNVIEIQTDESSIEFSYVARERTDNKVSVVITVRDRENGLTKIELPGQDPITIDSDKKEEKTIDYEVEIGTPYIVKITSESGETKEETILVESYWHDITKNLGEGISINNAATKAEYNKPYTATLTTEGEYVLDTLIVKMDGTEITEGVDVATGEINIANVTGDIEITATAKKLEIQYTAIAVSTSPDANNTSSLGANTQTKGTTLYINIIAKLEGTACTVTLKDDETKVVPYAVKGNGKYTFTVTGTYNGKTITTTKEVTVDQYQSATGLVQYDAGEWTQEEISQLSSKKLYDINLEYTFNGYYKLTNDTGLALTFGGFTYEGDATNLDAINNGTVTTSRNKSVGGSYNTGYPKYDGWQILESKEKQVNGETRTYVTKLVHAGNPENFVMRKLNVNDAYRAEYILSSGKRQSEYNTLSDGKTIINNRSWDLYKDKELEAKGYIKEVHIMTYDEALAITNSEEYTNGIRNVGQFYWLANTATDNNNLYDVNALGGIEHSYPNYSFGIRPVIEMNEGVYIASGDGTEASPFVLAMETSE